MDNSIDVWSASTITIRSKLGNGLWYWEIEDGVDEHSELRHIDEGPNSRGDKVTVMRFGNNAEMRAIARALLKIADEREARGDN